MMALTHTVFLDQNSDGNTDNRILHNEHFSLINNLGRLVQISDRSRQPLQESCNHSYRA
jgi:hypothetical protein